MKVGDLIKLVRIQDELALGATTGIIVDMLEDEDGFYDCLILFPHGEEWIRDIQLEVISESR